jgi:hypothetical protein
MRNPSPAPAPDTAERAFDRMRKYQLDTPHTWLDALEPFVIDWELVWPM